MFYVSTDACSIQVLSLNEEAGLEIKIIIENPPVGRSSTSEDGC